MKPKYSLKNLTPPEMCAAAACHQIYELEEISSEDCAGMACAGVYRPKGDGDVYVLVGRQLSPEEVGLASKVGEGEAVIEIPKITLEKVLKNLSEE